MTSNKPKLAIIGASYLQNPLILKAKEMGFEAHVFAWKSGDIGEKTADCFYPISITEKEKILDVCRRLSVQGVCSIASDLANITVAYVAEHLSLPTNGIHSTHLATDKFVMREAFEAHNDPIPRFARIKQGQRGCFDEFVLPLIVKPTDRSGSRGITKVDEWDDLPGALEVALSQGFDGEAIVEEYVEGREYSVEYFTQHGVHHFLAITQKYTTGSPHFIETAHLQPAEVDIEIEKRIRGVVEHALDSLEIKRGASHSEVKVNENGDIAIIEIGSRMGGDFIGSHLVELSTGFDFLSAVISAAVGNDVVKFPAGNRQAAMVRFVCSKGDYELYRQVKECNPDIIAFESEIQKPTGVVSDSSTRFGCFGIVGLDTASLHRYLPESR